MSRAELRQRLAAIETEMASRQALKARPSAAPPFEDYARTNLLIRTKAGGVSSLVLNTGRSATSISG